MEQEDASFLRNFVLKSGSLKEIAKLYRVSYPTVRMRLDKLIQRIELSDQLEEEPFQTFIKGLAVDSRIDLETAKIIIEKYKSEKEKSHEVSYYHVNRNRFIARPKLSQQKEKDGFNFYSSCVKYCRRIYLSRSVFESYPVVRTLSFSNRSRMPAAVWCDKTS